MLRGPRHSQDSRKPQTPPPCKPELSEEFGKWGVGGGDTEVKTVSSLPEGQLWEGLPVLQDKAQRLTLVSDGSTHDPVLPSVPLRE